MSGGTREKQPRGRAEGQAWRAVRVGHAADGSRLYLVEGLPDRLPPVISRDIARAWELAHDAAAREDWGETRLFRFVDRRPSGDAAPIADLVLADRDACCWAAAVDRLCGLGTFYGLSLCLRLLALVELMGRARWMAGLFRLRPDGAELAPALLAAAAYCPLGRDARFDEATMRGRLPPELAPPDSTGPGTDVASTKPARYEQQAAASRARRGALA